MPTDGQPGIFATLDAGAPRTIGLYFRYDVKQVDPTEWSSPPWDAALINKPGLGKVVVGRGAVNQNGPQAALLAALKAHLAKRGYGDIEVRMTGGYDPTSTLGDSAFIRAQLSVYRRRGIDPLLWPRNAGSWPGYVFTGEPLRLPAGHFGLGHGSGAHAPDEYYVIESADAKIQGIDGAVLSFAEYVFELTAVN